MSREAWLRSHPWLVPMAHAFDRVEAALARIEAPAPVPPRWDDHRADYEAGVPLLRGTSANLDLRPAGTLLCTLIERLAEAPESDALTEGARDSSAQLRSEPSGAQCSVEWLLGDDTFVPCAPGFLRYVGWTTLAHWLRPVVGAFAKWRDEDRWLRAYCPVCGSAPAMAQMIGVDPERKRLLACGCCGGRWRRQRTACPFCENDSQRIGIVTIEGEGGLRIDHCELCKGYLKTYVGEGNEAVLLADWTSLHLDVIAHQRGLERMAASLYAIETVLQQQIVSVQLGTEAPGVADLHGP
jgi:FdhE protein